MRVLSPALVSINLTPAPARRRSRVLILPNLLVFQACAATVISAVTRWEQRRRPALLVTITNMFLPLPDQDGGFSLVSAEQARTATPFPQAYQPSLVTTIGRVPFQRTRN